VERVRLTAGDLALELAPEIGGSILGFTAGGAPLMRPTPPEAVDQKDVRRTASFPLVPYSNRIAAARFSFGGEQHRLAPNPSGGPHAIHGAGLRRPWTVEHASPASARLRLDHAPSEHWPYAFSAAQTFELTAQALTLRMEVRNADSRTFPAGLGHHPYFVGGEGVRLTFNARRMWEMGPDQLPTRPVPAGEQHLKVAETALDNVFDNWDGRAEILWPGGRRLLIEAEPVFGHLVVFTPPGRDFFAVEPVSHLNDAINRMDQPGHGLRVLAPGETLSGAVTFRVAA
jgi:aldose 1-epimerase